MSSIRRLFSILSRVSSGSDLHVLSISLFPTRRSPRTLATRRKWSYLVDRSGLLDVLVGADMLKVLDGFPALSQLRFKLWENDEDYNEVWWKEEMVCRLPSRFHAVTIELYMYGTCFSCPRCSMLFMIHHTLSDRSHLWFIKDDNYHYGTERRRYRNKRLGGGQLINNAST